MKFSLALGTAYLVLRASGASSAETLPVDDAAIFVDELSGDVVGFRFFTDVRDAFEWKSSWESFPGGFSQFLLLLESIASIIKYCDIFFISELQIGGNIREISACAYVDVDALGNPFGIEFLFRGLSNADTP